MAARFGNVLFGASIIIGILAALLGWKQAETDIGVTVMLCAIGLIVVAAGWSIRYILTPR